MLKQVILARKDLKMPKGKLATQCSHASVESVFLSDKEKVRLWRATGAKKVILKVDDENELLKYFKHARTSKLAAAIIKDAGKTFFKKPTITCVGIGPDSEQKIDRVTGHLKMI